MSGCECRLKPIRVLPNVVFKKAHKNSEKAQDLMEQAGTTQSQKPSVSAGFCRLFERTREEQIVSRRGLEPLSKWRKTGRFQAPQPRMRPPLRPPNFIFVGGSSPCKVIRLAKNSCSQCLSRLKETVAHDAHRRYLRNACSGSVRTFLFC